MVDAATNGGVSRTRGSGRGERLLITTIDSIYGILADYTPHGDVPRRGMPLSLQRHPATGLLAIVASGVSSATGSALRLTVRGETASGVNIDVSRSDAVEGVGPGQRRILLTPDDLVRLIRFVANAFGSVLPRDLEFRGIAQHPLLQRSLGIRLFGYWDDFVYDGRTVTPNADFPFAIDFRYERGDHADRVVVFDEKGTPVQRRGAPDKETT